MADPSTPVEQRHHSNLIARDLVVYVRSELGDEGVQRLLELAGDRRSPEALEDISGWSSYDQGKRLLDATEAILGPGGPRRAADHLDPTDDPSIAALFRSLGSPGEVLRFVAESAAKFSTVVSMSAMEITDSYGIVSAAAVEGFPRFPTLCQYTAGALAMTGQLFGLPLSGVVEEQCQSRGDPQCRFRVTWSASPPEADPVLRLKKEVAALSGRFESLKETVAELVAGHDVNNVLGRITARAGLAARAIRYLLAVRTTDGGELRVVHEGFDDAGELASATAEVMAANPDEHGGSVLVTEVISGRRHYGRLAAFNAPGVPFLPEEQSLFATYAGLAAVALDSATALEDSRRQTSTARALLGLAGSLANLTAPAKMAERIAAVLPELVGCSHSGVLLWDEERRTLKMAALHGYQHETGLEGLELHEDDIPLFGQMRADGAPLFVDGATDDPILQSLLVMAGLAHVVFVPTVAGGTFYGVILAGWLGLVRGVHPDLLDRIVGVADQAATALQNAHLLDRTRRQSLHDPLTGLPNQRLLEEHVVTAIAQAKRSGGAIALLFVDLDRFKNVNDTLGHAAGDQLLLQIAERLRLQLRDGDVVARLAGDEFGVLLASDGSESAAVSLAERIHAGLEQSFILGQDEAFISSSIGIARFPDDGQNYTELLRSADTAMYQAKASGRATHRSYAPSMQVKSGGR